MGDMREALREGDQTTTGGILKSSAPGLDHNGRRVAGDGDWANCPACKKDGQVMNDAFPSTTLPDGRQILVRGARVMCACSDKPLVIPSQHSFKIEVNRSGMAGLPIAATAAKGGQTVGIGDYDEMFVLRDEEGLPVANQQYQISTADGQVYEGTTNSAGETARIRTPTPQKLIIDLV